MFVSEYDIQQFYMDFQFFMNESSWINDIFVLSGKI